MFTNDWSRSNCTNGVFTSDWSRSDCTNGVFTNDYSFSNRTNGVFTSDWSLLNCTNGVFTNDWSLSNCTNGVFTNDWSLSKCANSVFSSDCHGLFQTVLTVCSTMTGLFEFSSLQFKTVSIRSEKPTCAPPHLSRVSPNSSNVRLIDVGPSLILLRKIVKHFLFHSSGAV